MTNADMTPCNSQYSLQEGEARLITSGTTTLIKAFSGHQHLPQPKGGGGVCNCRLCQHLPVKYPQPPPESVSADVWLKCWQGTYPMVGNRIQTLASACSISSHSLKPLSILPKKPFPFDFEYLLMSV